MNQIVNLLESIAAGATDAADKLFLLVYDDLRRQAAALLAREQPGQTLDPTGLVHEAYLRLVGGVNFNGRTHFYRTAAEVMRRILIDQARRKQSLKAGGGVAKFELSESDKITLPDYDTLLMIDEALSRLSAEDAESADIARLRLFAGLTVDDAAELLGQSRATAFRNWQYARAFLTAALQGERNS